MEKKRKKKWIVILVVVLVIVVLGLGAGYVAINKMFSAFSDSFYQTEVTDPAIEGKVTPTPESTVPPEVEVVEDPTPTKPPKPSPGVVISQNNSRELIEAVPFSDKISVMNILSKNLSAAQYKELVAMLTGGITTEEINRAKTILKESLSPEDKKIILEYYAKYSNLLK